MRPLLLLCLLLPGVFSLHILVYLNLIGKSHLQFNDALINKLVDRGHTVDLIIARLNSEVHSSGKSKASRIVSVGFPGVSPWNAGATQHLVNPFIDTYEWNPFARPFTLFGEVCDELCDLVLASPEVEALLNSTRFDAALVPAYDFCPFGLVHRYGIRPVLSFAATPAMKMTFWHGGIPELPIYENKIIDTNPVGDRSRFIIRVSETIRAIKDHLMHKKFTMEMTEKFRAKFGSDFPDMDKIVQNNSIDFTNSNQLLEEPRPISHRLRYIGGVGLPPPKRVDKDFDNILDISKKGTVLFSFGTQVPASNIPLHLIHTFAEAFKRFPEFTFLWKLDGHLNMNASNVFNVDWLPQTDLLYDGRVVAFISHMGLNSFTEASFAGVPVLAIPLFADQIHNGRRAEKLGLGVVVAKTAITVDSLTAALHRVLYEKKFRTRAAELAEMLAQCPDDSTRIFIEAVEFAAKFPSLHLHYTPVGVEYSYLVSLGWDVAIFLAASSLLLFVLALVVVVKAGKGLSGLLRISRGKAKAE